jgi:hypothetical protein
MTDATVAPRLNEPYLSWRTRRRPVPGFAHVLGAVAGAFTVIALVAFVAGIDSSDPQVPGVVGSLLVLALALGLGSFGAGPVRSAATTAIVLTVPLLWLFALFGGGDVGHGELRAFLLLTLGTYAAFYLVSWTKGRAVLLAGTLVLFVIWIAFEIGGDSFASPLGSTTNFVGPGGAAFGASGGGSYDGENVNAAVMVVGIVFLVLGGLLDLRRLRGTATPFVVVGALAAVAGGVGLGSSDSTLAGGVIAVMIGAAVGIVGAAGRERRFTTWYGVFTVFSGLVAILADLAPSSEAGVGGIALGFAIVVGLLAWWLAPVLGEPNDGDARLDDGRIDRAPPGAVAAPAPISAAPETPSFEPPE